MKANPRCRTAGRLLGGLLIALLSSLAAAKTAAAAESYAFQQPHMGVTFKLLFYAENETTANRAAQAAFARIAALDKKLSDYDPQSELSRLSQTAGSGQAVRVSDDLWRVLVAAQRWAARSDGAFDVTVGPYVRLWRRARRAHQMPSPERLDQARAAVGFRHLRLNHEEQTAQLLQPDIRLDLGGIAKGYAADAALAVLAEHGLPRALVDASGDLALGDPPPERDGWRIGIAPLAAGGTPSRYLQLARCAVATSGDAWQFVELDGQRYSHIVDPATGLGLTTRSSVTIIAPDCISADALASTVSVLGPERGLALINQLPDTEAVVVWQQDGETVSRASRCLERMTLAQPADEAVQP